MREKVKLLAKFFRCSPREVLGLLTDNETECLVVEALVNRARKVRRGRA